jgi:phosphatidylserine decarboxylase
MKLRWASEMMPLIAGSFSAVLVGFLLSFGWVTKTPWARGLGLILMVFGLSLSLLFLIFFRDPERFSLAEANKLVAPADGRVMVVETLNEERVFKGQARRIAIFMHVGNVHVQRVPTDAKLLWTTHFPGKFLPAYKSTAGFENEQQWYAFSHAGKKFAVVQIAGLLARRINCWIKPDAEYARGTRMGMISFGSEVDVYLPLDIQVSVKPGDIVRAGETIIGEWPKP